MEIIHLLAGSVDSRADVTTEVTALVVAITGLVAALGTAYASIRHNTKIKENTTRISTLEKNGGANAIGGDDQIGHDDGIRGTPPAAPK